ncbi:hypothetical protein SEA_TAQUITO_85 [Mycobacterium phage Taquito]|uniref:Uncharacterized protein n=1 Tax=Mycobacterium phage Taquito TaxID=1897500 RepID=A0A1D8EQ88_9CAUD|nr:hypothetical protein I5G70_gp48 [Mycobacterium phage Taquito]AOT23205.1 hypothetical protein SEA_TAQUITO_85 [Mycobacterium phage Taquito]
MTDSSAVTALRVTGRTAADVPWLVEADRAGARLVFGRWRVEACFLPGVRRLSITEAEPA